MNTQADVKNFLAQRSLAVAGVSRSGRKFGNTAYRALKAKGYNLFPIHPEAEILEGDSAYPNLSALPEEVGGLLAVIPPAETEQLVRDAAATGITRVWMQQGAESENAIRFCEEQGIRVVAGECILMFAEPTGFGHKLHRWVWKLLGKLPK